MAISDNTDFLLRFGVMLTLVVSMVFYDIMFKYTPDYQKPYHMKVENQTKLELKGPLLLPDGSLVETGWATHPIKEFEKADFFKNASTNQYWWTDMLFKWPIHLRYKEMDQHVISSNEYMIIFTATDFGFMNEISIGYYNFQTKECKWDVKLSNHPDDMKLKSDGVDFFGKFVYMKSATDNFNLNYQDRNVEKLPFDIAATSKDSQADDFRERRLNAYSKNTGYSGEISLWHNRKDESMNLVQAHEDKHFSWTGQIQTGKLWSYTNSFLAMPVSGALIINNKKVQFSQSNNSFGSYFFSRSVGGFLGYSLRSVLQTKLSDGQRFGQEVGGSLTAAESSKVSTDGMVINGRLVKLEPVEFDYDEKNFMSTWKLVTKDIEDFQTRLVNLEFIPFHHEHKNNWTLLKNDDLEIDISYGNAGWCDKLVNHFSNRIDNYIFGVFNGWVVDDNGQKFEIKRQNGLIAVSYYRG